MDWTTLVSVTALRQQLGEPDLVVIDCRFRLSDPGYGAQAWEAGHIAGARHADLDRDLSDLTRTGHGRHPLPDMARFRATLGHWGVGPQTQVVAYDADAGMLAARLWWMLRAVGHRRVAVLDGGLAAWQAAGGPITDRPPDVVPTGPYPGHFDSAQAIGVEELVDRLGAQRGLLVDARGAERFRGEVEPLDTRAGHVPGAINHPWADNLDANAHFRPAAELRTMFAGLLGDCPPEQVVHMCGSGVSACHNLLAMEHAGLPGSRLYADSWSGWISDPQRPIATGA